MLESHLRPGGQPSASVLFWRRILLSIFGRPRVQQTASSSPFLPKNPGTVNWVSSYAVSPTRTEPPSSRRMRSRATGQANSSSPEVLRGKTCSSDTAWLQNGCEMARCAYFMAFIRASSSSSVEQSGCGPSQIFTPSHPKASKTPDLAHSLATQRARNKSLHLI